VADLKDLYLKAAQIDGKPGIYFVGPYGRRVSFASQQQRALNTVWALEKAGKIAEGFDVAVIGGGLAGITAATALAARKCAVWLYEKEPRVLNTQASTQHRYVHPSVNFWPERAIDGTTQFPFYDWYEDICSPVLARIHEEWVRYFKPQMTEVFAPATVTSVGLSNTGGDLAADRVRVQATGSCPSTKEFDAAIFATGFGEEVAVEGCINARYWTEDYLSELCAAGGPVLVSGTGDGGLIDALRCVHRDFDFGRLCTELANQLDHSSTKKKLQTLEKTVQEKAGTDDDKAADLYAATYPELLATTPLLVREMLQRSLAPHPQPVRLVGRLSAPYSLNAAPIHKLMVTHALAQGAIVYLKGKLRNGPILEIDGQPDENLAGTTCVARHGATPPLGGILSDKEIEELKSRQQILADLLHDPPYSNSEWHNWEAYPAREVTSTEFARFRLPLASRYVMDKFHLRVALGLVNERPSYVIGVDPGGTTLTKALPLSLFGIPAISRPASVIDEYAS
jgi:hypothetical protein